jgi:ribosomal protein L13
LQFKFSEQTQHIKNKKMEIAEINNRLEIIDRAITGMLEAVELGEDETPYLYVYDVESENLKRDIKEKFKGHLHVEEKFVYLLHNITHNPIVKYNGNVPQLIGYRRL